MAQAEGHRHLELVVVETHAPSTKLTKSLTFGMVDCPICLENITHTSNDDAVCMLNCNHKFHYNCVSNWIQQTQKRNVKTKCPCCLTEIKEVLQDLENPDGPQRFVVGIAQNDVVDIPAELSLPSQSQSLIRSICKLIMFLTILSTAGIFVVLVLGKLL